MVYNLYENRNVNSKITPTNNALVSLPKLGQWYTIEFNNIIELLNTRVYFIILFVFLIIIIVFLTNSQQKDKIDFDSAQTVLEKNIAKENNRLAKQKQKVEIVDDFKKTLKTNNDELFIKIATMNNSLFKELFDKNKS